jgi:peptide/nickel transport system ATP-binding protein/oligopeptide transport system ATP-binding protein
MGLTYIFISHDLQVVHYFCDIIAVMYLGNIVELGESKSLFKRPLHPYTKSLLLSIPKEHPCIKKEPLTIKGEIPTPINPPAGCVFHTRCPYATPICQTEKPQMAEAEKDHQVACHHWEKVSS